MSGFPDENGLPANHDFKRKRNKHMTGNKHAKKKVATLQSKEAKWDKTKLLPIDSDFSWCSTSTRMLMRPWSMSLPYIFNALKKVVNNFVNELINRGFDKEKIRKLLTENLAKL